VDAAFYFDLASPLAYLAAERVLHVLPGPAEWQPVLASELRAPTAKSVVGESHDSFRCEREAAVFREEVARRAGELGLQPLRWPEPFPFDSALAMRAATYAKSIGRAVPFAQAAFRQAFAGGRDLRQIDSVLIAAAACEMHPAAVTRGAQLRSVADQLAQATRHAIESNIRSVPAVIVGGHVCEGERAIDLAAEEMLARGAAR
jgi:2-hydroxychromene-2-carboxylate isomerase